MIAGLPGESAFDRDILLRPLQGTPRASHETLEVGFFWSMPCRSSTLTAPPHPRSRKPSISLAALTARFNREPPRGGGERFRSFRSGRPSVDHGSIGRRDFQEPKVGLRDRNTKSSNGAESGRFADVATESRLSFAAAN